MYMYISACAYLINRSPWFFGNNETDIFWTVGLLDTPKVESVTCEVLISGPISQELQCKILQWNFISKYVLDSTIASNYTTELTQTWQNWFWCIFRLTNIIDVTGASSYHGFLPVLVRSCIQHMTGEWNIPIEMIK